MKRFQLLTLSLLLLLAGKSQAQKLTPAEFNGGGGSGKSNPANISLDYSLGNSYGTSTVALSVKLTGTAGRMATEEDVEGLPATMKEEILSAKAGLKAWPVPSEGPVNLALEGVEEAVEARVYDQTGKLVQQLEIRPGEPATLQTLTTGVYFIRTTNASIPIQRIVIK